MRKLQLTIILLWCAMASFAQVPQGINYQAVVRDASGNQLVNQPVSVRMTILQNNAVVVYQETHAATTNDFGLVNLVIGQGTVDQGVFAAIDWSAGNYFAQTEVDVTAGGNFLVMGSQQLMSVPYAMYAQTAGSTQSPNIQRGKLTISDSQGNTLMQSSVTFDVPFEGTPYVICSMSQQDQTIYDDSFNVTTRNITSTGFEVIINRVDGEAWGQFPNVYWIALD
jgi:hypothetical protein